MSERAKVKELSDISYEAKKNQLETLMVGGSAAEPSMADQKVNSDKDHSDQNLNRRKSTLFDLITSKAGSESHDAWRLFSKAKNALEDGARLENLSWRLFHMKLMKDVLIIFNDSLQAYNRINSQSKVKLPQMWAANKTKNF